MTPEAYVRYCIEETLYHVDQTAPINKEELHRCYDKLPIGLCIVQAGGKETILFANREACLLYDCLTEEKFVSLTGGTFRGMTSEDGVSLSSLGRQSTLHFQYLSASHHLREADGIVTLDEIGGQKAYFLHLVGRQMELAGSVPDELTRFLGGNDFFAAAMDASMAFTNNCPVCFNVANFRGFNRENGMEAGNRLLSYIARTLRKTFPEGLLGHMAKN